MYLEHIFSELLLKIGFNQIETTSHWDNLQKGYTQKSRHYHNLNHLQEMIVCFEKYKDCLQFPHEILYSIFYHDYIYKATSKENELKSAEFAVSILPTNAKINKDLVFEMILATKLHEHSLVEDINWLIDFDLKILSKEWKDYEVYFKQIRKEYRIYPNFMYNPGRKKALEHFLEKETIYLTKTFRMQYEKQARENIKREIALL
ncbi:hypothetical protein HUE46_09395 [Flavobacterium columnare]|uniref:Metal-dependent HD superfamily phosphohydrolase n=1 Tax=Flavobacterium columnare (strain ATCC 49512 / CIP 103533 / TG 44/87) TaxID=1041826 RepID=G8X549_FLACA|nr:hypothetical protein [Flavobacterium columnare]AEW85460.1 hypothetical protein FCOL_03075 [Flavobacterium columnare ATCC 49512]PTD13624.1 hypothetical protein C6N29_03765 [Flavobacterium columnare]QOG90209.1 hypothetical protein HUE41_09395 [Flavobacterium columnare]QOG92865.1 hypothetical protein HUE42_09390 [Flavobacterium columnare]QOG95530.1 hypothetical protein HUE43_09395 [Flavobacterium columnare]